MTRPATHGDSTSSSNSSNPSQNPRLPPEILEIIRPAFQFGTLSGASGLLFGTFAGVLRSKTPVLFAIGSGISWATIGITFWASRSTAIHAWGGDKVTAREKVSASAIGGAVGGTAGGLLRASVSATRGNIVPGAIMFALFGAGGQALYNRMDAQRSALAENEPEAGSKKPWWDSKWSPVRVLSEGEYGGMLREKLRHVDSEIAKLSESIEALQVQEKEKPQEGPVEGGEVKNKK